MNRLVRGSLVLVIVSGMVVAASTARADVPDEWKSLDVAGLTALAQQFVQPETCFTLCTGHMVYTFS